MMRYRLVVVAGPRHPLARRGGSSRRAWPTRTGWSTPAAPTPPPRSAVLLARLRVPEERIRVFPSLGAAWAAPADGEGVAPGVAHLVAPEVERGRLVVLPVEGTPVDLLWHVTTLGADRRSPMANRLRRFLDTPRRHAGHAHRADGSVPVSRFRPPVYVTLWS